MRLNTAVDSMKSLVALVQTPGLYTGSRHRRAHPGIAQLRYRRTAQPKEARVAQCIQPYKTLPSITTRQHTRGNRIVIEPCPLSNNQYLVVRFYCRTSSYIKCSEQFRERLKKCTTFYNNFVFSRPGRSRPVPPRSSTGQSKTDAQPLRLRPAAWGLPLPRSRRAAGKAGRSNR